VNSTIESLTRPADPKGGRRHVSASDAEGVLDHGSFEPLETLSGTRASFLVRRRSDVEVIGPYDSVALSQECPREDRFKLTNVAGPRMGCEPSARLRVGLRSLEPVPRGEACDQVVAEHRKILGPLAQRRDA
jgi:hypothetical protein